MRSKQRFVMVVLVGGFFFAALSAAAGAARGDEGRGVGQWKEPLPRAAAKGVEYNAQVTESPSDLPGVAPPDGEQEGKCYRRGGCKRCCLKLRCKLRCRRRCGRR